MSFDFHLPTNQELQRTAAGTKMRQYAEKDDFGRMLLTGCAGSGKTTVAILRLIRLIRQEKKAKIFTYHKMLVMAIRQILRNEGLDKPDRYSDTFKKWVYRITGLTYNPEDPIPIGDLVAQLNDILNERAQMEEYIIDEGQDFERIVYGSLPHHCQRFLVSADDSQQVHQRRATVAEIRAELEKMPEYKEHYLYRNFRNTYEIYRFSRQFQPKSNEVVWDNNMLAHIEHENRGEKPLVVNYRNDKERNDHIFGQLRNSIGRGGSVAVLCPLGETSSASEKYDGVSVQAMFDLIRCGGFDCSFYYSNNNVPDDLRDVLVTTYKSAKGLEFDEVYLPRYNFFKAIPNEWYVACTRARRRLVIYRDIKNPQYDPIGEFDSKTYEKADLNGTPF